MHTSSFFRSLFSFLWSFVTLQGVPEQSQKSELTVCLSSLLYKCMRIPSPSLLRLLCLTVLASFSFLPASALLCNSIAPFPMLARRLLSHNSISTVVSSLSSTSLHRTTLLRSSTSAMSSSAHIHSKPKVLVPIADGSEEIEAVTIIDTLVRGGAEVTVASVTDSLSVVCSRGVKLTSDCSIRDCTDKRWDMVICPGGMPGAQHLSDCLTLTDILHKQMQRHGYIGAICAAPAVVLARHHFLTGKHATCYPVEKFTSKLDHFLNQKVVIDGNVITSQGPGTSLDFALTLVELLCGGEKAAALKKEMIHHHH